MARSGGSRSPGYLVGRIRGVPIYLGRNWPFIVLIFVVLFNANGDQWPAAIVRGLTWAALLLASVLLHEFAHSLVAQRSGLKVRQIVCDLWGGHTSFLPNGMTPERSALIGIAGPAMNGVLAAAAYSVTLSIPAANYFSAPLLWLNLGLFLFNVLPGLPLDGGQVVSAIAWRISGNRTTGIVVGAWSGRVVTGIVLAVYLVYPAMLGNTWSVFDFVWAGMVALIMWRTTSLLLMAAKVRRVSDEIKVRDVARPTVFIPGDTPLADLATRLAPNSGALIGGPDGAPLGLLVLRAGQVLEGDSRTAADLAQPPAPDSWSAVASLDDPVSDLLGLLQLLPSEVLALEVGPGQWGLLWRADVERAFNARRGAWD